MQPLSLAQSPGAQRKPVRCFTNTHDPPPPLSCAEDEDENPYETIGPPRPVPSVNHSSEAVHGSQQQASQNTPPSNSDSSVTLRNTAAEATDVPTDSADSFVLRDSEQSEMERLQLGWEDSEMLQCMNQAKQARISRSFSIQTGSSDRSRRTFSESSNANTNHTNSSTDERKHLYAYVDSLGVKEPEIIPSHVSKTLSASISMDPKITIPPTEPTESSQIHTKPPMSPVVSNTAVAKFSDFSPSRPRQNSVPKLYPKSKTDSSDEGDDRPRSQSIPHRVSPANFRRRDTDVDTAIANAPEVSQSSAKAPRKPSRKMEYVNMKSYEPDTRKKIPQYYDSDGRNEMSGSQLSQSYHSSTASSSSSRGSSVDVAVFQVNTPPVTENTRPRPPSPSHRLSIHVKDSPDHLVTFYENLPNSQSSARQSDQKPPSRHRLGSSDPDSSEERGTRPVLMQRHKTPPQTAPRKTVNPPHQPHQVDSKMTDEQPTSEEHHSRLIISYSKPGPEHSE